MKKANLFKPEEIAEIYVKCPVTVKDYLVAENDPDCFCPACGEPHEVKDYHVFYKDGSNAYANCLYMPNIPETPYVPSELIHSEEDVQDEEQTAMDVEHLLEEPENKTDCYPDEEEVSLIDDNKPWQIDEL